MTRHLHESRQRPGLSLDGAARPVAKTRAGYVNTHTHLGAMVKSGF
ncbi:hypothetical protein [Pseudarthrobacter sp. TAF60_1]